VFASVDLRWGAGALVAVISGVLAGVSGVHFRGRKFVQHGTKQEHECGPRCRPHTCQGLSTSSIRQIHGILSGACNRAVRWRWLGTNPID